MRSTEASGSGRRRASPRITVAVTPGARSGSRWSRASGDAPTRPGTGPCGAPDAAPAPADEPATARSSLLLRLLGECVPYRLVRCAPFPAPGATLPHVRGHVGAALRRARLTFGRQWAGHWSLPPQVSHATWRIAVS